MGKARVSVCITLTAILVVGVLYLSLHPNRPRKVREANDANDQPVGTTREVVEVDINSGDIRRQEYALGHLVDTTISESALSREVRRLAIDIPSERDWQLVSSRQSDGVYVDGIYGFVPTVGERLMQIFDKTRTRDDTRRAMLSKFTTSLRTEDWVIARREGDRLITEAETRGKWGRSGGEERGQP